MSISAEQCRAARAMLNWSQTELSEKAGVARATIAEFEGGKRVPILNNLNAIQNALEIAGAWFLADGDHSKGTGVSLISSR